MVRARQSRARGGIERRNDGGHPRARAARIRPRRLEGDLRFGDGADASKKVSPATFQRAEAALGRNGIIEAVSCAGFYGMIGFVLNTFEIPPQSGGDVLT